MNSGHERGFSRQRLVFGFAAAAVVSGAAHRAKALTGGGAIAAAAVGTSAMAGAGLRGARGLVAYFISSTLLGRLPSTAPFEQQRGNQRDAVQVLANGGVAALLASAVAAAPPTRHATLLMGYGGAIATAAADTWATEIGTRFGNRPRALIPFQPVAAGASGGVTAAGFLASVAGAVFVGAVMTATPGPWPESRRDLALPVILGGITGALADSILGSTVQEVRFCDSCARETERRVHQCGRPTRRIRGAPWCNNDVVNTLSTAFGAATAMAVHESLLPSHLGTRDRRPSRVRFPRDE